MDLLILANAADDVSAMETVAEVGSPEEVYKIVAGDSLDFDSWTSLISEIEKTYLDNIKAISSVYESFLSWFPLCHGYWKKFADHMARLCNVEKAVEIFEQAVQSATYSVGLWVDYCSFSVHAFADPFDVRRIFERGLSFVGKDFLCHRLWDLYIRFELSQQQWSFLACILIRALKFPTKSLHKYYDNFKEFAAFVEEDMSLSRSFNLEPYVADLNIEAAISDDEIYNALKELQDSSSVDLRSKALNNLIVIAERYYYKSCRLHEEIDYFENNMERDYFNVKPLDDEDLQNWHNYLDFIEKQEDFDWAVKTYERCLIPCAIYPEFWMRYVEFMESKGGRELANFALERATQVFLKNVTEVHIFNARFREKIGDIEGARAAFHLCDTQSDSSIIETAIYEANMETRLGNVDAAIGIYVKALKMAAEKQKMNIIPSLYIHFFRLKFLITGSADAAIDLLISGIQQVPFSRLLLEELINFAMMHEGLKHLDEVDHMIDAALTCGSDGSQVLSSKDREDLSNLYLKFVDYCGTTHDIRKAWNRHIKYFPRALRSTLLHKYPSSRLSNEPKKPRKRKPHLVAKQLSRDHSSKRKEHKSLNSKIQSPDLHKPTVNRYREKDDDISLKKNTCQQSEDNADGELEVLKHQSRDLSQNNLQVLQKDDQIRTEPEKDCEREDAVNNFKSQPIDHHKPTVNQYREKDDDISLKKNTCFQQSEDNTDGKLGLKHQSRNLSQNNLHILQKDDQIRTEPEKDCECEDAMNPSTTNQNPVPSIESAKKQNITDEHEQETDPQQFPSQNKEPCKSDHMLTASELVPNVQQPQNPASASASASASQLHLLTQNGQPIVQYPVQSSEQPGVIQNPQAYNQTWQYQYQSHQQWLQMQPYIQQQQQQQQFQPQQHYHQFYQQQEQYQQYWLQLYQQQQQQLQEYNMQVQQYQQTQQPKDLHQNHLQQIAVMSNLTRNISHDQQGQGTIPPNTTMPYTQPNHANVAVHPMAAPTPTTAPTNITSPSNRQPSSDSK